MVDVVAFADFGKQFKQVPIVIITALEPLSSMGDFYRRRNQQVSRDFN